MTSPAMVRVDSGSSARSDGFYSPADVVRLARVSPGRLRYWQQKGVIAPNVQSDTLDGPTTHGYSFEYLVYVGLLRTLLDQGYSLEQAVRGLHHLRERFGPPGPAWFDVRLAYDGSGFVAFKQDEWGATVATRGGQRLDDSAIAVDFTKIGQRLDGILIPEEFAEIVEMNPAVREGMPVIRGTTIRTSVPYRLALRGMTPAAIHQSYPRLSIDQITRAIAYEQALDRAR